MSATIEPRRSGGARDTRITRAGALASVPAQAIAMGTGAAAIALLVVLAAGLRSEDALAALEAAAAAEESGAAPGSSSGRVVSASDQAPAEALEEAKSGGPAAIEALAQRYPKDPAVLKALVLAHAAEPSGKVDALGAARRLLELAPEAATDGELRSLILSAAGGPPEAATAAFDLMANRMGSTGPEMLYDLAIKSTTLKSRAMRLLGEPAVIERATPALRIAYELRAASSCNARKPLLDRAAEVGDRRAVDVLAPLTVSPGKGCGFLGLSRCPAPCAAMADDIKKTIEAIEARDPASRPATSAAPKAR
jgi:hypothetical protein